MEETVTLLADQPADNYKLEIAACGELIRAAKENRLTLVVATGEGTEEGHILCATNDIGDGNAEFMPIARLYTSEFCDWMSFAPPACAAPAEPSPLDIIEEEDDS